MVRRIHHVFLALRLHACVVDSAGDSQSWRSRLQTFTPQRCLDSAHDSFQSLEHVVEQCRFMTVVIHGLTLNIPDFNCKPRYHRTCVDGCCWTEWWSCKQRLRYHREKWVRCTWCSPSCHWAHCLCWFCGILVGEVAIRPANTHKTPPLFGIHNCWCGSTNQSEHSQKITCNRVAPPRVKLTERSVLVRCWGCKSRSNCVPRPG